jgi:hypothetical protein
METILSIWALAVEREQGLALAREAVEELVAGLLSLRLIP